MRSQLWSSITALVFCLGTTPSPSTAAVVGNWSRTCTAPNWKYGGAESVWDQNVYSPVQAWAFAERMPDGHWRISYNLAQLNSRYATPSFFQFLFYRECAYVKYHSPDQHLGDCQALADMKTDIGVSPEALEEISAAYASRGFPFPTGGACAGLP